VRLVCPSTGWRGGRSWCWVWPGLYGCGRWRPCWRWRGWVLGWCSWVGCWCRRRGGRGGRCPAGRRGEPASPVRGLVAGVSGWGAPSPTGVLAVGRPGLAPAVPADPPERHAVGPVWLRPGVLVDPPGHVGGPWGPVLARSAPASLAAKEGDEEGDEEGDSCPGRRVTPRRQQDGAGPVPAVRCRA